MFLRKIGKLLLGKASGLQVLVAATLGSMLGFVPGVFLLGFGRGLSDAPALVFSLLFLVLILNTNLAVFGLSFVIAKLSAVVLLPVSYEVGHFLLHGPTRGIFEFLVNAPFFAWMGLERYATTGGLALGLVLGIVLGLGLLRGLQVVQARLAQAESGEQYQKWASKFWVRSLCWIFLGVRPKDGTWSTVLEKRKKGPPIRIAGAVVVVLVAVGLYVAQSFFAGPTLRHLAQGGLEKWNGATVDLAQAAVDLSGGRVTIAGLAMADPRALERDNFRARSLDVEIGTAALLRRRFVLEKVQSSEASSGTKREKPGARVGTKPEPPVTKPAPGDGKTIEDYVREAETWKGRLQQVSRVLQRLVGSGDATAGPQSPEQRQQQEEAARERARLVGLARATATHLVHGAPRVLIRDLVFDGVRVAGLGEDLVDVRARNLSTNPGLVDDALSVSIQSRSGGFAFEFSADPKKSKIATSRFVLKGISIDSLAKKIVGLPLRGGTLDVSIGGKVDCAHEKGTWIDLPLEVTLHKTKLSMDGVGESELDGVRVPLGLRGPLASPRIAVETKAFVDALVAAGRSEIAKQVQKQLNTALGDTLPGVGGKIGDVVSGKKSAAELAEDAAREAKKRALDEAKKRAQQELEKVLPGNLFGGKKKTTDKTKKQ